MFSSLVVSIVLACSTLVFGLGSSCTAPLGAGSAGANDPYWLETIPHRGSASFNSNPGSYPVFRNVKDYGARGDGVTDDTAAINAAISAGGRCGLGCDSTTTQPAIVYIPRGTYVISSPLIALYYSQIIGDAKNPPTLMAAAGFAGMAVIDADPYIPGGGGAQYYVNQNNFFRSIRNIVIDLRRTPVGATSTGIHWQVSQATSLMNIRVEMSTAAGTNHQGIWMENGSGGFMGDLTFNGGRYGMWVGNQQFAVRNLVVRNAQVAVFGIWAWGWTFQDITIENCGVGFDLATGTGSPDQTVGAEAIMDVTVTNTPIFVRTSSPSNGRLAGSLVLNSKLQNAPIAVGVLNGATVLTGGTTTIANWAQGNVYTGSSSTGTFRQASIPQFPKPDMLLQNGKVFGKMHPQYANYAVSQFASAKANGVVGNGVADDTAAIQAFINKFWGCKILFFDHGSYIITNTITIPAGTQIVGEAWSVIMAKGANFNDQNNPRVAIKVGDTGSVGVLEITDMIFGTSGTAAGAIVLQWNVHEPSGNKGAAGMWDTHIRIGGAKGTNLDLGAGCGAGTIKTSCNAAFMALHLTSQSSAYLEGTWVWLADHDLDSGRSEQISIFSGRGLFSESQGPVWLIGTGSEHHTLYQYNFVNARNHYIGLAQTESPYYQPAPAAPAPFVVNSAYKDPTSFVGGYAWGLRVRTSSDIIVFGSGFYSFFNNYGQTCIPTRDCQQTMLDIDASSSIQLYSIQTVATTWQLTRGGVNTINQSSNLNGFASTITAWTQS